ncbi:MAG TPA: Ldh family oxidoreductase [Solirubrobacteraceae bacterium]
MTASEPALPMEVLKRFTAGLLMHVGVPQEDADLIADALVSADARGMQSHGLVRLPVYVRRIVAGGARPGISGTIVHETATTVLLDGQDGIGQVIAARAMHEAIRKARDGGAGVVGVRRSNHFGEGAYYVARAITEGMIGLITTSGSPNMPYWGGREPVLGTLPLAVGVPARDEMPIVLDLAFGTVSKGKVIQAAAKGERIPSDWAVDSNGDATDDPQAVLDGGWILPIGGYKGSGLILIMEILSAVLTGARFATEVYDLYGDHARPQALGHFAFAIDVEAFMPLDELTERVDRLIRMIKATGPDGELLMPGEREQRLFAARQAAGIPLPADTIRALGEVAREVGLPITKEGREFLVTS